MIARLNDHSRSAIEALLGLGGHVDANAARDAQLRLPTGLRAIEAFNIPNLVLLLKGQYSISPGAAKEFWHINTLARVGAKNGISSCSGLRSALRSLETVLNAIFSPDPAVPLTIFSQIFSHWRTLLDLEHGQNCRGLHFGLVMETVMTSLCTMVSFVKGVPAEKMSPATFRDQLLDKTKWNIVEMWRVNQFYVPADPSPLSGPAIRVKDPIKRKAVSTADLLPRKSLQPPAASASRSGSLHPKSPCIAFVAHQLGIPGQSGCSRASCAFEHISVPAVCTPETRTRLVAWFPSVKDGGLRALLEAALSACP